MKLKKIKNALFVVLTLALVAATSVAITWALTKSMTAVTNEFTNKSIAVQLSEQKWDGVPGTGENDLKLETNQLGKTLANGYTLNSVIPKNPSLYNSSSAEPEYVAMTAYYEVTYKKDGDTERTTKYLTQAQFNRSFATLYSDTSASSAGINSTNWEASTITNNDASSTSRKVDVYYYNYK